MENWFIAGGRTFNGPIGSFDRTRPSLKTLLNGTPWRVLEFAKKAAGAIPRNPFFNVRRD